LSHIYTLAVADSIIAILVIIVIVLLVLGGIGLRQSRIIRQRNEQLRRILNALDDYRAIVGDGNLSLDEQEEMVMKKSEQKPTPKTAKAVPLDEEHAFFVKMDARVNKEKPFTDPDFDYYALIKFMGVSQDEFCRLVPRYTDPERTKDYINSLRAEYAAKLLMEYSDSSMEDIVVMCGFKNAAAFNKAFKFSFGIMPTDYLNCISQMFKKKV
jgi:AraC-like DNA-binding protein